MLRLINQVRDYFQTPVFGTAMPKRRRSACTLPPAVDVQILENRNLLTVFTVNSVADNAIADGQLTLREAVIAANTNSPFADAPAGENVDTIVFSEDLHGQTIVLNSQLQTIGQLTIEGPEESAGTLSLSSAGNSRLFENMEAGNLTLRNLYLSNGRSDNGGAILNHGLTELDSVFIFTSASTGNGGGITNLGSMLMSNSSVNRGSSELRGGGIYNEGQLAMVNSRITDNIAGTDGGGLASTDGTIRLAAVGVSGNRTSATGGGVYSTGGMIIEGSSISENYSDGAGAGIVAAGQVNSVVNTTIAFNRAEGQGGGIAHALGELQITNSTIAKNKAGAGGQLHNLGGGIATASETILNNSIVIGNTSGDNDNSELDDLFADAVQWNGSFAGSRHNVIGDPHTAAGLADGVKSNHVGKDGEPRPVEEVLSVDSDFESFLYTLPLVPDSVAIDHGSNLLAVDFNGQMLDWDIRGDQYPRLLAGSPDAENRVDAGAYEFRPLEPVISVSVNQSLGSADFKWQAGASADHYEVWVENLSSGQIAGDSYFVDRNVVGTTLQLIDLPNGNYRVWIANFHSQGGRSEWVTQSFSVAGKPEFEAIDVFSNPNELNFIWYGRPEGQQTEFWIQNVTLGEAPTTFTIDSDSGVNDHLIQNPDFGRHNVWIRTINSAGVVSPWSDGQTFWVQPQPAVPNGSTFDRRPQFSWAETPGAEEYEIWISHDGEVTNIAGLQQPNFTPDNDLPAAVGHWWVRASANGQTGPWSKRSTFDTSGRAELRPDFYDTPGTPFVTAQWETVDGAAEYQIYARHQDTGVVLTNRRVRNATSVLIALPSEGIADVWIRAFDDEGGAGRWSTAKQVESPSRPSADLDIVPGQAPHTFDRTPELTWQSLNAADGFQIAMLHEASSTSLASSTANPQFSSEEEIADGTWRWFVRAEREGTLGEWSEGDHFFVGGRTVLLDPLSETQNRQPVFVWQSVRGASRFEIEVRDANNTIVISNDNIAGDLVMYSDARVLELGSYRAWIRAIDANGDAEGYWSPQHSFQIV